jgi:Ca2+-binding RTX toxin-like protein
MRGGTQPDEASYIYAPRGVTVSLAQGTASGVGLDSLRGISAAAGSRFADQLVGDAAGNGLLGEGGDDTVVGADGEDFLSGDAGNDNVSGGEGDDRLYGGTGPDDYGDGGPNGASGDTCIDFETEVNCEN